MKEVAKYHRLLNFPDANGIEEEWLAIDCAFLESGIKFANANGYKRILFGTLDKKPAANASIDVLQRFEDLEGVIWQIPIRKGADLWALASQSGLKYLSIVEPNLKFDLISFPRLECLIFLDSETVTGFGQASTNLRSISVTGVSRALGFLGAVKNLAKLKIIRSDIESLAGIERITQLEELSLVRCGKLADVSHAAGLRRLRSLSIEGSNALTDLSALEDFNSLEALWIKSRMIESCAFIPAMKSIEFASINAVIADNDLSPLLQSETLAEVWFSPAKRTYSPRLSPDEVNEVLRGQRT